MKLFYFILIWFFHIPLFFSLPHRKYSKNLENSYEIISLTRNPSNITLKAKLTPKTSNFYRYTHNPRFKILNVQILFQTKTQLRIIMREDGVNHWELPDNEPYPHDNINFTEIPKEYLYSVDIQKKPFGFKVRRLSTNETIFDISDFPLILSQRYLEISSVLPSDTIFGLGESVKSLKLEFPSVYTMWARDLPGVLDHGEGGTNTYGLHPMYLAKEKCGFFDIVYLRSSNGMDVMLNNSYKKKKEEHNQYKVINTITYKITGGILDFKYFLSEKRKLGDLIQEYHDYIGKYTLQMFWSFGFHQSRWGYRDLSALNDTLSNYHKYHLPLDAIWMDIDYMDEKAIFTIDELHYNHVKLNQLLDKFQKKLVLIIDPGVKIYENKSISYPPYERGVKEDLFIKDTDGKPLKGCVWAGSSHFPDFFNPKTEPYWEDMLDNLHKKVNFSGIWLDMNEISNFVDGMETESCDLKDNYQISAPLKCKYPYSNQYEVYNLGGMHSMSMDLKTICLNAVHDKGLIEYNVHNLNALFEAKATYNYFKDRLGYSQPFILSRSNIPGTGKYAIHWSGDNVSSFKWMKLSIAGLLAFNIFGIPNNGADICGFAGNAKEELCARWMQIGTLYPFSRNHNSIDSIDQDPFAFGGTMLKTSLVTLRFRYSILKYYYSLFVRNKGKGMVLRPLFFEFPEEQATYENDVLEEEFLIGKDLLITPVLKECHNIIYPYFPGKIKTKKLKWFDINTGEKFIGGFRSFVKNSLNETAPIFIRSEKLIFRQDVDHVYSTDDLDNTFYLSVALERKSKIMFRSEGKIMAFEDYKDQNKINKCLEVNCMMKVKINIIREKDSFALQLKVEKNHEINGIYLSRIELYGLDYDSHSFKSSQKKIKVVKLKNNLLLTSGKKITIKFN